MRGTLYSTADTPFVFKNRGSNNYWYLFSDDGTLNVYWGAAGVNGATYSRLLLDHNTSWLTLNSGQGRAGRLQFNCSWGNRSVYTCDGAIGFLDGVGSWSLNVTDTGAVWTKQLGDLATRIEDRAIAWANDRVTSLQYRLVSLGQGQVGAAPNGAVMVGYNINGNWLLWRYPQVFDPVRGWVGFYVA